MKIETSQPVRSRWFIWVFLWAVGTLVIGWTVYHISQVIFSGSQGVRPEKLEADLDSVDPLPPDHNRLCLLPFDMIWEQARSLPRCQVALSVPGADDSRPFARRAGLELFLPAGLWGTMIPGERLTFGAKRSILLL